MNAALDAFGREAVHDRQWTQHIVALPADGCSALTGGAVSTFYGPCYIPSVFTHEMTHTLDAYVNDQTGSTGAVHVFSTTSPYQQAISEDSCVPDPYSNTGEYYLSTICSMTNIYQDDQEDFAQVSVLALYEKVNPGGLDPIGPWRCLVNQKNSLDSVIGQEITQGGTCTRRWADSTIVSMGPAAGNSKRSLWSKRGGRTAGPKPEPANKIGDPLVNSASPVPASPGPGALVAGAVPKKDVFMNLVQNHTARVQAAERINAWNKQVGKPTVAIPSA